MFPIKVIFVEKEDGAVGNKNADVLGISKRKIVVVHSNIIEPSFWEDHPWILDT